jgi:hypothetical protein
MALQWKRKFSLVLGDAAGEGLDLSEFHCKFQTHRADTQTPGWLTVRIYNLSESTRLQIQQEYTNVFLQAGYEGNFGLIFKGKIRQKRAGRESPVDTFLDLLAQDGDTAYNYSVVNKTLAAGWKSRDVVDSIVESMKQYDVVEGYTPEFAAYANPRGKVMFGMARDTMRDLADTAGASWCIHEGKLTITPLNAPQPGEAFVLNAMTGLIGLPVQTIEGINVRCLLNPNIKFGGQVVLDNESIQDAQLSVAYSAINQFPGKDDDGFYKVYSVQHVGDTRGQSWYSDLITVAVDGTKPLSGPFLNAVASSTDK